jgi:oligopeptide transport system permease protein
VAGVMTGLRRGRFLDNFVLVSSLFLISIPILVIGYAAQWYLGIKWQLVNPTVSSEAPWNELIVPALVLASASIAYVARLSRTSIAENLRSDYVRTATAKGLTRGRVVGVHLLRNSMIPVVTFIGLDLGALMAGAIITEGIFNIQGIGGTLYRNIVQHDSTIVVPIVTVLVLVYLIMNLIVDLLYGVLDPRIRYE